MDTSLQPILVNGEFCRGCDMCVLACSLHHTGQTNPALARLRVSRKPDHYAFTPHVCVHCLDPECLEACPSGAMVLNEEGIAHILYKFCDSCGLCHESCLYDAIGFHEGRFIYLKCDLCWERADGPVCVEVCPTGALSLATKTEEAR